MVSELTLFKRKISLSRVERGTIIYALAISVRAEENSLHRISCKNGSPIGRDIYDFIEDCYYVDCAALYSVGEVSFGYEMEVEDIANWSAPLPLPEAVFKLHLGESEVQKLNEWKATLPQWWKVRYVQLGSTI